MAKKMQKTRKTLSRKAKIIIPVAIVVGLVVLIIAGFTIGTKLEDNNNFCGSCHTQPELTYLDQSKITPTVNLASFHIQDKNVRCVECHSGPGISGRVSTLIHGLLNGIKFWTGNAAQPVVFQGLFPVANCLKCHADFIASASTESGQATGHWHYFLSQWEKIDPNAGTCASCHLAHPIGGDAAQSFIIQSSVRPVCSACHAKLQGN
jgi:predicted CXXCH cytochrome family protein